MRATEALSARADGQTTVKSHCKLSTSFFYFLPEPTSQEACFSQSSNVFRKAERELSKKAFILRPPSSYKRLIKFPHPFLPYKDLFL